MFSQLVCKFNNQNLALSQLRALLYRDSASFQATPFDTLMSLGHRNKDILLTTQRFSIGFVETTEYTDVKPR